MDLNQPFIQREPTKVTTIALPFSIWEKAKINLIEFKKATIFGINFLIADKQGIDYPHCNLTIKLQEINKKLSEVSDQYWELKDKYELEERKTPEEEVDNLLKNVKTE